VNVHRISLVILLFICSASNAADIWHEQSDTAIRVIVEGEIVPGDFDRLKAVLRDKGPFTVAVHLYSPGGDAREAMKIGRMLHALKVTTEAPLDTAEDIGGEWKSVADCPFTKPKKPENCVCLSACFLAWIAGINREGGQLGVHRPRFNEQYFASLSVMAAKTEYNKMMTNVENYLNEYMVPQEIKEKMMMTPSHEIYTFNPLQFTGFVPAYDELLSARCGAFSKKLEGRWFLLLTKRRQHRISTDELIELEELDKQRKKVTKCRAFEHIKMEIDAFSKYFGIDYLSRIRSGAKK
jgi:hypothetical protein